MCVAETVTRMIDDRQRRDGKNELSEQREKRDRSSGPCTHGAAMLAQRHAANAVAAAADGHRLLSGPTSADDPVANPLRELI